MSVICKYHILGTSAILLITSTISHQSFIEIYEGEDFDLCQKMTFASERESLVTQLKGNVTLVIASHNVNYLCGVACTGSRDRVICGIEVSLPFPVLLMHHPIFCPL